MTKGDAMVCLAHHCAQDFVDRPPLLMATDDPEGTHPTRVALRRFRAVLARFRPIAKRSAMAVVADEAKDLFRLIGRLRDAEIVARTAAMLHGKAWHRTGRTARHWRKAPAQMLSQLSLEVARSACADYGPDLVSPAPEVRHSFGKHLKTVRYLCAFFTPLWPHRSAAAPLATMKAL